MKTQTAFDYVSSSAYPSQSFFKTVKCIILLLVCAFIVSQAAAQTRSITGTVRDNDSAGKPLPGASVDIKSTKKGTSVNSSFTLALPKIF